MLQSSHSLHFSRDTAGSGSKPSNLVVIKTHFVKLNSLPKQLGAVSIANRPEITSSFIAHPYTQPIALDGTNRYKSVRFTGLHQIRQECSSPPLNAKPVIVATSSVTPEGYLPSPAPRKATCLSQLCVLTKCQTTSCAGHLPFNPPATSRLAIGSI